ncbi:MAG: hypothetical protein BGP11_06200 [Rhodobacterales bacterium 65-51]|uniref:hypothetical protein n=1 Tax=uncultured Gemmobacter sp. TaxID=1095917 RepID=UPI00096039A5|nr:hypothetical protein [uncultured Gemmobacter sp.]OJY25375.1 MAG: hypothetical protein BGP11_06200 [Rhodobacterales bacterium 65-51]
MSYDFILPARIMFHMQRVIAAPMATTRVYLSGVRIEPIAAGGAFMVATDGVAMLIHRARHATATRAATIAVQEPWLPDAYDEWGERLETNWAAQQIRIPPEISDHPVAAGIVYGGREEPVMHVIAEEISGAFPDWRKAVSADFLDPSYTSNRVHARKGHWPDCFDPRVVSETCSLWRGVQISRRGDGMPWLITMEDDPDTLAVISPRSLPRPETPVLADMLTAIGRADLLEGGAV